MMRHHVRALVIADDRGKITGFVDESDITRAYLDELSAPATGER
jgi:hypothetical protein